MKITPRRKRILTYILVAIVIGFALLTAFVSLFPPSIIDIEFSEEVQEHQFPLLDFVMKAASYPGYMPYSAIIVAVTALAFYLRKHKREAVFVLLTSGAAIISTIVKFLVNRPRPTNDLVRVVSETSQQSFPSGHVMFYVVFFGFLTLLIYMFNHINKPIRWAISIFNMALIFTIPVSRIYLGAHWFTDVLGGFLLGILYLFGLSYFYLKQR